MALIWHDWFATADVDSQQLSIEQAQLFQRRWMGSFLDLLLDVTVDPAMLIWLSGIDNTKSRPERELRPRADGAVHARRLGRLGLPVLRGRRARAGARADRLGRRLGRRRRLRQLPLRPAVATTRARRRSSARRGRSTGRTRAASASSTPPTARFFVEKLWSYFIPVAAVAERRARRSSGSTSSATTRAPGRRGDPHAPGLLPRAGDGQAADRLHRRAAAGPPPRRRQRLGLDRRDGRPARSSARRTSPAGTRRAGSTRRRSAGAGSRRTRSPDTTRSTTRPPTAPTETPKQAVRKALEFWGNPPLSRETPKGLERYAGAVGSRGHRRLAAGDASARCARTRCGC